MTTILVVEDEAVVAIDIVQHLKHGGYDAPAVAATGEAALRMAEELHPDLVLMDILLKGEKDGIETAREIEDQFEIPIIFLTGQADETTLKRIRSTSHYGFLLKPIDVASLFPTIEMALARHAFSMRLKESENRFRAVTDSAADTIFSIDMQGNVTYWNKAAERTFGWTADEITGQSVTAILPESAKAGFLKMLPALGTRETYKPTSFMLWRRKDGTEFPAEPSFASWKTKEGTFATAIVRDTSERKRAEAEHKRLTEDYKRQARMLDGMLSASAEPIFLLDPEGRFLYQNEASARAMGAKKSEAIGKTMRELGLPADIAKQTEAQLESVFATGQAQAGTVDYPLPDGIRNFEYVVSPVFDPHGDIEGVVVSDHDVTEQKRMQAAIAESETHQKAILESVQTGIVLIDPTTHKIVDVNTTAARLCGAPKEAIIGSVCHRFICPADVGHCPITDLGKTVDNAERVLLTADGKSLPILKSVSRITLGGHDYLLESFIDISDRKQMERALLESEAYYRAIFESSATGMAIVEEDMTVAMVNSILEQLTGFSKNEVEGLKPWTDFVAPEDLEVMKTYHRERRRDEGNAPKGYDFRLLTKDGKRREAFLTVALIPGTQRSVVSIVDLTALKRAQEAVRKQAGMLDAAHDCIVIFDDVGTLTYWNRGAERLYGWTKQEADGQNVHVLLQTTFPESREALWPKLVESGAWEGELIHVARDGRPVTVASSWTLLKNETRNTYDVLEICSDITQKKQADEALNESERHIRELTNALPVIVFEVDATGVIKFINTTVFDMFGYTKEEIEMGVSLFQLIAPAERERTSTVLSEGESWGNVWLEQTALRKDGSTFPLSVRGVPIMRDGAVVGIRGIAVDITERKRADETLVSELAINSTIARLSAPLIAPTSTIEDIALAILDEAKGLTGSEAGFVGLIDLANRDLIAFGLTQMMAEECAISEENRQIRFPIGPDGSYPALWGYALTSKKGFYTNAPATHPASRGTPDGHTPLAQLLAAPALVGENVVGQVAVANPGRDYTERDLKALERLADVYALAVVRTRAEDALKQAKDDVQALNEALQSANEKLRSDIAERKKAELALAESEAKLSITFTAMVDGVVTGGLDWKVTYCNEGLLRITQRSKEEVIGKPFVDLLAPEGRSQILETIPELLEKGNIRTVDKMLRKNGASVDVEANVSLIKDAAGQPTAFLAVIRDVTERQKAELALADSEAKLRITFATMADGIVLNGLDRKVTDCNEAVLRLTQRSREEIIGKLFTDLLAPEFRSQILETIPELLEKGTVRTNSKMLRKNGASVDVEANVSLIKDAAGQPTAFLTVTRDVTERKQMEQQLDKTLDDLKRSNAELEQFAYIASHDLQEPLRMIASYIQIIEEDYKGKLDADADQYITFTVDGAKRMQTLINDLLAYSRVGTRGEPFMPTSMSDVLSEAIANLEVAIEESHAVVTHDQLPIVLGDESQLIQLFQNLVGNAIKFRGDVAPIIHVGVEETNDDWVFSVRDNGIGIDMKYAERIFTVFQRLHAREEYPGTGIGLAVVKKIVERHGGHIWVKSTPAKGSTFYFTLPKREDNSL